MTSSNEKKVSLLPPLSIRRQLESHGYDFKAHYDVFIVSKNGTQIAVVPRDKIEEWCLEASAEYFLLDAIYDDDKA